MLNKAIANTSVDSICFDLEDSVTAAQKSSARNLVLSALEAAQESSFERCVRVNSLRTKYFSDDLAGILKSPFLQTIVMPKIESAQDLHHVASLIDKYSVAPNVQIIASLESAKAIIFAKEIAAASHKLCALLFAAEDYCANVGIQRTISRNELYFARSTTVHAAKAYGLQAIDMVCVAYKDMTVLAEEAEEGSRLGFDGKQAIHPDQIHVIQGAFGPSESEIKRAVAILEQNREAEAAGKGSFGLQGDDGTTYMIDAPMLLQAQRTIQRAQAAGRDVAWSGELL